MSDYSADYKTEQIPLQVAPVDALRAVTQAILRTTDLAPGDADIIADALVTSELRNLQGQGQGVRRVRAYVDRVRQRQVDPAAPFDIVKQSPALALVDAHNGPGTVVAVKAMRMAIAKANIPHWSRKLVCESCFVLLSAIHCEQTGLTFQRRRRRSYA